MLHIALAVFLIAACTKGNNRGQVRLPSFVLFADVVVSSHQPWYLISDWISTFVAWKTGYCGIYHCSSSILCGLLMGLYKLINGVYSWAFIYS